MSRRRLLASLPALLLAACGSPAPKAKTVSGTERVVEERGEWWLPPDAGTGRLPTVVLVHGGYWGPSYDRHLEDAVAADLSGRGYLCWNIDYAAADQPWPTTLRDAAAAYDALATGRFADRVDPARLSIVGHSAGGHLALWLASRKPPFARTGPAPVTVVAQAPVAALAAGQKLGLGGGAIDQLLGGSPREVPERYAQADPVALLPSGVRTVLLHSETDALVPVSQSETYLAAAEAAGDDCTLERVPGDHFAHLDPKSEACARMRAALA
ncbi:MAG: alpha/beta hydrolase [Actinobacteria bacterium]|nr:alpha/beta hydrolase [Actinomycetota bacterium]